jgi:GDP-4-dehydro-6-deoxy-D-mannose reductase
VRVLVTGAAGFVGSHLLDVLAEEGAETYGMVLPGTGLAPRARAIEIVADMNDRAAAERAVGEAGPDAIVHLAGQPSVHQSWANPAATLQTNVLGIVNLLDAARRQGLRPVVLVIGSAEEYGLVSPSETPLAETAPLRPSSPYAVSKVAQAALARLYGPAGGMRVVLTRTFPHTGPGRGETFAESSFARQIAEIEAGLTPPVLRVGNLEAVRDFTDVRDVVCAYRALLDAGEAGEIYNVCGGRGWRIGEMLEMLQAHSDARPEVRVERSRLRPSDIPVLVGDSSKLRRATGWEPRIPLEQTLGDLLEDWRGRVRAARPSSE